MTIRSGIGEIGHNLTPFPVPPMLGIYAATTRKTLSGQPIDGWFSEEVITVEDVLRACTYNGAYSTFEDGIKGSLAPGMLADIAVLDANLLGVPVDAIKDVSVVMTLVGGRLVYDAR